MEQISILDDNKRIEINKRKKEVKFVAIDVETTGLSPVYNELIEIIKEKISQSTELNTVGFSLNDYVIFYDCIHSALDI